MRAIICETMLILLATVFLSFTSALPDQSTQNACKAIEGAIPGKVTYQGQKAYTDENKDYWSMALPELKPACIVLPTSADDVSVTVKVLNTFPDVKFAIKSGGHSPNPGQSSIQDGVLIAMKKLTGVTYDQQKGVAYVNPGGHWSDVIGPLDKQGVTVVGGRLGIVGIGGYLTQGGLSFLSAQYGMAADNVVEFETVMANGSIIKVNMDNNKDLMVAMRGSGDQFGIVTKFTLKTYPIGKVWGGYRIYTAGNRDAIFSAAHDFIQNPRDPKAAVIVNHEQTLGGTTIFLVFYFYDGPSPPPGAFGKLTDIKAILDFTTVRTYTELLNFNAQGANSTGQRASFRSITLPHLPANPEWYSNIMYAWQNISAPYLTQHFTSLFTIAFQPFPGIIGKQSAVRGGNAMGLGASDGNRFILEINCLWKDKKDDETIYKISKQLTDTIQQQLASMKVAAVPSVSNYNPFFMNDATFDQDVIGSYQNVENFRALQKANDPQGLFAKRAGGFKY